MAGAATSAISYLLLAISYLLSACAMPGDAAPVVKIGVIAPFEGVGRPLGYAVLPAIKAAIAEANASGALGRYRVSVVAFNDDLHGPTAAAQAQALALDPDVLAVLGPWSADTPQPQRRSWPRRACLQIVGSARLPPPGEKWGDAALASCDAAGKVRGLLDALAADIAAARRPRGGMASGSQCGQLFTSPGVNAQPNSCDNCVDLQSICS